MALAQRRMTSPQKLLEQSMASGNEATAKHVIKEGGFDRRHIPLITSLIHSNHDERKAAAEQFLEERQSPIKTANGTRYTTSIFFQPSAGHFKKPIDTLLKYALIEGPQIEETKPEGELSESNDFDKFFRPRYKDVIAVDVLRHILRQLEFEKKPRAK